MQCGCSGRREDHRGTEQQAALLVLARLGDPSYHIQILSSEEW